MAATGNKVQRLDRPPAVDDRQPRQVDEEHRDDHRAARQGARGRSGSSLNDDTIARNVEDITEDAGGFVRSITKLQTIVGLRTEYNFLANTLKNYLSVQLMPRPDKFYLIELVEDPRGYSNTVRHRHATARTNGFVEHHHHHHHRRSCGSR